MKKVIFLLTACFFLSGCQLFFTSGIKSEQTFSPAGSDDIQAGSSLAAEQIGRLLNDYIRPYEKYAAGIPFAEVGELEVSTIQNLFAGWLEENQILQDYAVYNEGKVAYYQIPRGEAVAFYRQYFSSQEGSSAEKNVGKSFSQQNLAGDWQAQLPPSPEIMLDGAPVQLENGHVRVRITRTMDGKAWYPAEYEFAPCIITEYDLPENVVAYGETAWKFVSLSNLPMPEPEVVVHAIATAEDLLQLADEVNDGSWDYVQNIYQLANDIDMYGIVFPPIGQYRAVDLRDPIQEGFCAILDGQGHTISNLTIASSAPYVGLFSVVGDSGMVVNLKLENCSVQQIEQPDGGTDTDTAVGAIAGKVYGTLQRCTVNGSVSGEYQVGGLAGIFDEGSYAWNCRVQDGIIVGSKWVGGLAGVVNQARINDCIVSGRISGNGQGACEKIGGLVGENRQGKIDRAMISVAVSSPVKSSEVGRMVGNNSGPVEGCFYDQDIYCAWPMYGISTYEVAKSMEPVGLSHWELQRMGVF